MGITCRIVLSLLVIPSLGVGSALAAESGLRGADQPRVAIEATGAGGGLELQVDEVGSSIAALALSPMAPGETRSGEFRVGADAPTSAIMAVVTTTETHGGSDARGCFEHRLEPVGVAPPAPVAFTPYGGEAVQPLGDGPDTQTYRLSIRMTHACVPTAERPVSVTLVLSIAARA